MKTSPSLLLIVILLVGLLCEFFCVPAIKARFNHSRFEGQVSGFLAGLALSGVIDEYTAQQICSLAVNEVRRCQNIKKPPGIDQDPLWYSSHGDFGKFAFLCIERYAKENEDIKLLEYCNAHIILAGKLTSFGGYKW